MATPTLKISDGTITINFFGGVVDGNIVPGFIVKSWSPALAPLKGGGVWSGSPLSDGRSLVMKQNENTIDNLTLSGSFIDQDAAIYNLQELRRLLEKAVAYWTTDWQNEPVWIETSGSAETNTRYAIIKNYSALNDPNPFAQPMFDCPSVIDDFLISIEHGAWADQIPGSSSCLEISEGEGYRVDTCDREVFITNHHKQTQLTHIYVDNGGVFGANQVASTAFDLFPAVPAVNDAIYFGVSTAGEPSGPFSSLVFDIGTVQNALTTVTWQYWDGAWTNFVYLRDNTNDGGDQLGDPFDTVGVAMVSWQMHEIAVDGPDYWATTAVNGVTGWWVRALVQVVGGGPTPPAQQNRRIYTVSWPFYEIDADAVAGDIDAVARHILDYQSYDDVVVSATLGDYYMIPTRVFMGLRSNSRGENFTPFINLADEQNPAGITVTRYGAGGFIDAVEAPTGRCVSWNQAIKPEEFIVISFDNDIVTEYYGTYRAFLRLRNISGANQDQTFHLRVQDGSTFAATIDLPRQMSVWGGYYTLLDLGKVTIPLNRATIPGQADIVPSLFYISIVASYGTVLPTAVMRFYDLVLMPIDEWAGEFVGRYEEQNTSDGLAYTRMLDVDSITIPKVDLRGVNRYTEFAATAAVDGGEGYVSVWKSTSPSKSTIQANRTQRMWVLSDEGYDSLVPQWRISYQEYCYAIESHKKQQYLSMRGSR